VRLTAALFERWPDRVTEVVAADDERAWLLMRDGGTPIDALPDRERAFGEALPLYAELQQGEAAHAADHLAHSVPDLRIEALPAEYEAFCARTDLPLEPEERKRFAAFAPAFARLCAQLPPVPASVQHDDLHIGNVFRHDGTMRILDWGDTSISHPFFSLVVAFWHSDGTARMRAAYLEPWGDAAASFDDALRIGTIAHVFTWLRVRESMPPDFLSQFDEWFPRILRLALECT
jgi:hypothetical protein